MPAKHTTSQPDWHRDVPKTLRSPALIALFIVCVGLLGFGAWAGLAPINSAVIAQGSFVATGQNKTIQHLEGGIVRKILVKEGDVVAPGQVLISEALEITPEIASLIAKSAPAEEIKELAIQQGMVTILGDCIQKASEGITSLSELLSHHA